MMRLMSSFYCRPCVKLLLQTLAHDRKVHSLSSYIPKHPCNILLGEKKDPEAKPRAACFLLGRAVLCVVAQSCLTLRNTEDCSPPGSSVHGDPPGKNTGVGCHALLQGIFPTQGSSPGLPHCRRILYSLNHQGRGELGSRVIPRRNLSDAPSVCTSTGPFGVPSPTMI